MESKHLRSFECQSCGKTFKDGNGLRRHQKVHSSEKLYQCKTCGKQFNLNQNLKLHEKTIHSNIVLRDRQAGGYGFC